MTTLNLFKLEIPKLWEKEWSEAIHEAGEVEKELLIFQFRGVNLLKSIDVYQATPERLAWLSFWTKTFSSLDGAIIAQAKNSEFVLQALWRIVLELWLQITTILEPILEFHNPEKSPNISANTEQEAWDQVLDRLIAYTAWCLLNDIRLYNELIQNHNLEAVWNPNPAREIAKNPDNRKAFEAIFGPLKVEIDLDKLKQERNKQEEMAKEAIHRLEAWLEHPRLKLWYEKLNQVNNKKKRNPASFYALFDKNDEKTRQKLKSLGMEFAYLSYKADSMLIHGSTIDQLLLVFDENKLMPKFVGSDNRVKISASSIGSMCNSIFVGLCLMQKLVWQNND